MKWRAMRWKSSRNEINPQKDRGSLSNRSERSRISNQSQGFWKVLLETACCLWVDAGTVVIGIGNRANREGAQQVEQVLGSMGVEDFLHLPIPYGYAHIDSIISFVDKKTAVFDPARLPWDVWTILKNRGFRLFEAPSPQETRDLALNFVTLAPGNILMAAGFAETKKFLEDHQIQVTEVEISELRKGWGSLHCMTAVLRREPVGRLD